MIQINRLKNNWYPNSFVSNGLTYNLLPLLPPSLLVQSVGTGVTSSILPIFIPKSQISTESCQCSKSSLCSWSWSFWVGSWITKLTSSCSHFDVQSVDSNLFASVDDVDSCQHSWLNKINLHKEKILLYRLSPSYLQSLWPKFLFLSSQSHEWKYRSKLPECGTLRKQVRLQELVVQESSSLRSPRLHLQVLLPVCLSFLWMPFSKDFTIVCKY